MGIAKKASWNCPDCQSKLPKTNNTDTPVRQAARGDCSNNTTAQLLHSSPTESNVTIRNKQNKQRSPPESPINDDTILQISKGSLRDIIKQEIASALKNVVADQFKQISELIAGFRTSLDFFNEKYEEMKLLSEEKLSRIQALEKDNLQLQTSIHDVSRRLNLMEQNSRATNLEIQNVPENRSENLLTTVLQLGNTTNSGVVEADIAHCTRIAKKDTQTTRPRSILVKFNTPRIRDTFFAATIKYNKNNANNKLNTSHLGIASEIPVLIYVAEHLSVENKALHAATRLRGKSLGYNFVWVRNGRIFMKKDEQSDRIVITNQEQLKSLT
uniref:FP protein C-terminal domain-containing protein n=1 Tax=Heliothis virescens TaxID=7102 RepID=A0A2A4IYB9_HELVI